MIKVEMNQSIGISRVPEENPHSLTYSRSRSIMHKPLVPNRIFTKNDLRKRILVIDDEPEVCRVIQYSLEDIGGWETVGVCSAQDGILLVMTQPFDAIVLDVIMPGMDGRMFLKALRAYPDAPQMPIVLMAAMPEQWVDLEVAGMIKKPFDPVQLPTQVATLLNWIPTASEIPS